MKKPVKSIGERGSALLIVFVFAAAVAIMLYMEMPVAVFEAKRNKEQLLIDRGNEYANAAKLYYRKIRQYPPTIDAMENTNRMRFLRKRFKDPFTGKDDWRLLHAAPNGMLTDSKVNPVNNGMAGAGNSNLNANNKNTSSSSPFGGSNSPSGFGNSNSNAGFGGFNSSSSSSGFGGFNSGGSNPTGGTGAAEVVVPAIPQRPPAIAANSATNGETNASMGQEMPAATENAVFNIGAPSSPNGRSADPNVPATNTPQAAANGQVLGPNGLPVSPNTQTGTDTNPNNPLSATGAPSSNQNSIPPQGTGTTPFRLSPSGAGSSLTNTTGTLQGGGGIGIAGVASKAEGHAIKAVNDQGNYSFWEFYYDPTKDAARTAAGAMAQIGGGVQGRTGQSPNSGFNSGTNSSSGFGSFGGGLSGMQNSSSGGFSRQGSANSGFGGFGSSGTSTPNGYNSPAPTTSTSVPTNSPPQ